MQKTRLYKRCLPVIALVLVLALPLVSLAESYKVVTGGGLNLRKEPSLNSSVLGQYPTGTWMTVLETTGDWSKVQVNGKTGYVLSKYLTDSNVNNTLTVRTNTGIGLNVRTAPSLTGDIVTSFKNGSTVTVLSKGNGWYKVQQGDVAGYVASRFLSGNAGSTTKPSGKQGVVKNPGANQVLLLRETASTDARVLGYYRNGTSRHHSGRKRQLLQGERRRQVRLHDEEVHLRGGFFLRRCLHPAEGPLHRQAGEPQRQRHREFPQGPRPERLHHQGVPHWHRDSGDRSGRCVVQGHHRRHRRLCEPLLLSGREIRRLSLPNSKDQRVPNTRWSFCILFWVFHRPGKCQLHRVLLGFPLSIFGAENFIKMPAWFSLHAGILCEPRGPSPSGGLFCSTRRKITPDRRAVAPVVPRR